jgi:hypothetical protein
VTLTHDSSLRATRPFPAGGYRFIPSVFQFSGGVAAEPGYRIERVRFASPMPLSAGFGAIRSQLDRVGRPTTALCALELRSPRQFSEAEFVAFNREYVRVLREWGLMDGEVNPVARTNVCPAVDRPAGPSIHAFSYTVPSTAEATQDFVTAGGAEAPEGPGEYQDGIVRLGDTSLAGLREKVAYVRDEQTVRLRSLGVDWGSASHVSAYCLHDLGPLIVEELIDQGAVARHEGVSILKASPPVADCEFEMDTHHVSSTLMMSATTAAADHRVQGGSLGAGGLR